MVHRSWLAAATHWLPKLSAQRRTSTASSSSHTFCIVHNKALLELIATSDIELYRGTIENLKHGEETGSTRGGIQIQGAALVSICSMCSFERSLTAFESLKIRPLPLPEPAMELASVLLSNLCPILPRTRGMTIQKAHLASHMRVTNLKQPLWDD